MPAAKRFLQCSTSVNAAAVKRESIQGVEHIVVTSYTMPDNIVMNGVLYPAEEIAASFKSLERTLAPIEHPQDADGNYISALDPMAIHNFHAGAFNTNVTRDGDRVRVDKYINVAEAMKTDRGKRLLDRVNELETNDDPRPIHTSTGVFMEVDELDAPTDEFNGVTVNAEYQLIARNMLFDHDAILLDSVGAAQPHQGVGMAVNADGEQCEVIRCELTQAANASGVSFREIEQQLQEQLVRSKPPNEQSSGWLYIIDVFEDMVVFEDTDTLFEAPYILDDGVARIAGLPVPVTREVSYTPKTNRKKGDAMKELILNALAEAGIDTKDMDDAALLEAYNKLNAANAETDGDAGNRDDGGDDASFAAVVQDAIAPLVERMDGLDAKLNAQDDSELNALAEAVVNSGAYPALDVDDCKKLGVNKLRDMATKAKVAIGVNGHMPTDSGAGGTVMEFTMPNSAA